MVYVLDLGLAEEYWDRAVGQHVPLCKDDGFFGTTFFASRHAQKGWTQGRRDDLEAAGYMFVALLQGTLPWSRSWSLGESDEGSSIVRSRSRCCLWLPSVATAPESSCSTPKASDSPRNPTARISRTSSGISSSARACRMMVSEIGLTGLRQDL